MLLLMQFITLDSNRFRNDDFVIYHSNIPWPVLQFYFTYNIELNLCTFLFPSNVICMIGHTNFHKLLSLFFWHFYAISEKIGIMALA